MEYLNSEIRIRQWARVVENCNGYKTVKNCLLKKKKQTTNINHILFKLRLYKCRRTRIINQNQIAYLRRIGWVFSEISRRRRKFDRFDHSVRDSRFFVRQNERSKHYIIYHRDRFSGSEEQTTITLIFMYWTDILNRIVRPRTIRYFINSFIARS